MLYGFRKGQLVKTLIDIAGMNSAGEKRIVPAGAVGVVDVQITWPALVVEISYIGASAVTITYTGSDGPVENFMIDVDSDFEYDPMDYVFPVGPCVYVGVKSRKDFDDIASPVEEVRDEKGGYMLIKKVESESVSVNFQHSLRSLTYQAMRRRDLPSGPLLADKKPVSA